MADIKIKFSEFTRTNFAFPSEWKNQTGTRIHYRNGRISIFQNEKLVIKTQKDDFDIGGFMEDSDLIDVLKRDGILEE